MVLHPGGGAGGAKGQGVNVLAMGLGEMEYVAPFRNQSRYTSRKTDGQFDLCSFYFEPEYDVCFGLSPLLSACAPHDVLYSSFSPCAFPSASSWPPPRGTSAAASSPPPRTPPGAGPPGGRRPGCGAADPGCRRLLGSARRARQRRPPPAPHGRRQPHSSRRPGPCRRGPASNLRSKEGKFIITLI